MHSSGAFFPLCDSFRNRPQRACGTVPLVKISGLGVPSCRLCMRVNRPDGSRLFFISQEFGLVKFPSKAIHAAPKPDFAGRVKDIFCPGADPGPVPKTSRK